MTLIERLSQNLASAKLHEAELAEADRVAQQQIAELSALLERVTPGVESILIESVKAHLTEVAETVMENSTQIVFDTLEDIPVIASEIAGDSTVLDQTEPPEASSSGGGDYAAPTGTDVLPGNDIPE